VFEGIAGAAGSGFVAAGVSATGACGVGAGRVGVGGGVCADARVPNATTTHNATADRRDATPPPQEERAAICAGDTL
jgi:hypothetical protein